MDNTDIMGRLIFFAKLAVYSIPFMLAGYIAHFIAPRLTPAETLLLLIACLISGFLVMVFTHDDMWDAPHPPLRLAIKIAFFLFASFVAGCDFNLPYGSSLMGIFWAPLTLLEAQIFFRVTLADEL